MTLVLWSDFLPHLKRFICLHHKLFELRILLIEHIDFLKDKYHGSHTRNQVHSANNAAFDDLNELLSTLNEAGRRASSLRHVRRESPLQSVIGGGATSVSVRW